MDQLHQQFNYYVAHQDELVEKFKDRWIVLAGEQVVADFDSEAEAYEFASKNCEAGTFMIQLVEPGTDNYSQTFHSRVIV